MLLLNTQFLPHIIFEGIVALVFLFFWLDTLRRAKSKKTLIAKRLAIFMGLYLCAIIITFFTQFNKRIMENPLFPNISAIYYDQAYKIFVFMANYAFFLFYLEVFTQYKEKPKKQTWLLVFTIISIVLTLIVPVFGEENVDIMSLITIAILLVHSLIIYIPSFIKSRNLYFKLVLEKEEKGKSAVLSITLMSGFFISLWVMNIVNEIWDILTERIYGPFWLLSWVAIFLAVFAGYTGFVNPPWFQRLSERISKRRG